MYSQPWIICFPMKTSPLCCCYTQDNQHQLVTPAFNASFFRFFCLQLLPRKKKLFVCLFYFWVFYLIFERRRFSDFAMLFCAALQHSSEVKQKSNAKRKCARPVVLTCTCVCVCTWCGWLWSLRSHWSADERPPALFIFATNSTRLLLSSAPAH